MSPDLAKALAPLARFVADNIGVIERAVQAYDEWGINRLEAMANGYLDVDA